MTYPTDAMLSAGTEALRRFDFQKRPEAIDTLIAAPLHGEAVKSVFMAMAQAAPEDDGKDRAATATDIAEAIGACEANELAFFARTLKDKLPDAEMMAAELLDAAGQLLAQDAEPTDGYAEEMGRCGFPEAISKVSVSVDGYPKPADELAVSSIAEADTMMQVHRFLARHTVPRRSHSVTMLTLYALYADWCEEQNEKPLPVTALIHYADRCGMTFNPMSWTFPNFDISA